MHLLKQEFQTEKRSASWEITIKEQRRRVVRLLDETPWRGKIVIETTVFLDLIPETCPYTV